jgi:hypothetical protein
MASKLIANATDQRWLGWRTRFCPPCMRGEHAACFNDECNRGAVDAADFAVYCDCECEGDDDGE